jgi:hypothetical protein
MWETVKVDVDHPEFLTKLRHQVELQAYLVGNTVKTIKLHVVIQFEISKFGLKKMYI